MKNIQKPYSGQIMNNAYVTEKGYICSGLDN